MLCKGLEVKWRREKDGATEATDVSSTIEVSPVNSASLLCRVLSMELEQMGQNVLCSKAEDACCLPKHWTHNMCLPCKTCKVESLTWHLGTEALGTEYTKAPKHRGVEALEHRWSRSVDGACQGYSALKVPRALMQGALKHRECRSTEALGHGGSRAPKALKTLMHGVLKCRRAEASRPGATENAKAQRHRGYRAPGSLKVPNPLKHRCLEAPRMLKHQGTKAMEHQGTEGTEATDEGSS
ncbi:UNVERIFIED_CONTAM: hypothetical protein FKN15_075585 [Acipenser sinensis]